MSGSGDNTLKLWDVGTGEEVRTFEGHSKEVNSVIFSADGRYILSSGGDGTVKLWDASTSKEMRTFTFTTTEAEFNRKPDGRLEKIYIKVTNTRSVKSAVFSPDGKYVLSEYVKWDVSTGKEVGQFFYGSKITISPDGKYLLSKNFKTLKLWDIETRKEIWTSVELPNYIQSIALSPNSKYALSGEQDGAVKIWDVSTGTEKKTLIGHTNRILSVAFSPDGRYVLSGGPDNTARLWEVANGKMVRTILGPGSKGGQFTDISFLPDGKSFMGSYMDLSDAFNPITTFRLFDISTGRGIKSFSRGAFGMSVSPDGRYLFSNMFELVDINSGRVVRVFSPKGYAAESTFSPDGNYLLTTGENNLLLWDVATGGKIKEFKGHKDGTTSASFSPDAGYVVSGGVDGTIRLWSIHTGREIARFVSFTDGEWIVITPDGYYNSSANGDKHLNVRIGNNVYGIENYREAFFRPDLVKLALSGGSLKDFKTLADVKQPPVVMIVDSPKSTNKNEAAITLKITDIGGGIGDIRLYLNGSAVVLDSARGVKIVPTNKNEVLKTYNLKLTNGINTIRAIAFNGDNTMQSNDVLHEITASFKSLTKPSLNAIIVGINEYKNPKLQLKYAVSDAELFENTLKKVTAGLFEKVNIKKLVTKEKTTNESIIKELKAYKSLNPDDVFVFFVASHGTVDDGEYFLITSNVGSTRTEKLKTDALPQGMLKELIANIPATKKLIIIDTCSAGALGEAIQVAMLTRGMSEDTAMKILSRAVGSTILSASTSLQEALEGYNGHGLFTYVLAEGLSGKADKGKTGYVKTTELADYVDNEVPVLAEKVFKKAQYPTISISGQAFPIGKTGK